MMAAGNPLSLERMQTLFGEDNPPSFGELREALNGSNKTFRGAVSNVWKWPRAFVCNAPGHRRLCGAFVG